MIEKKSLADEVAHRIQQQILSGVYKTNDKLPIEPELMKNFGVGRSTVREAIKILSNSGFIKVQQGAGTFVEDIHTNKHPLDKQFERANVQELDEVRRLLEMKIAEKAAMNRTEEDILAIKSHLINRKNMATAGLLEECVDADIKFHTAIAVASKNSILAELYQIASKHLKDWFLSVYKDTTPFLSTQKLHEELLKHIITGNHEKAWNTSEKIIKWH